MKPGRELDALVSVKIFGWTPEVYSGMGIDGIESLQSDSLPLPHYSTDIKDAWEVVEKIKEVEGINSSFKLQWSGEWICYWDHEDYLEGTTRSYPRSDSAPHVICLAALKAVGVEV